MSSKPNDPITNTFSTDIEEKIQLIIDEQNNKKPIIVAYGLMNAGKSYLLNMLTQHISEEFFKTNDIRETATIKKFESEKYIYLDTPGLDANEEDDSQAQFGVAKADVVLFLHQPQGGLEVKEIDFLKKLSRSFGKHSNKSIIIVLSKVEKESKESIDAIEEAVRIQCEKKIGFSPKIFKVSNSRYKSGIAKNKNALIDQSNIKSLIGHIDDVAATAQNFKIQKSLIAIDDFLAEIKIKEMALSSKRNALVASIEDGLSIFHTHMESINKLVKDNSAQYKLI